MNHVSLAFDLGASTGRASVGVYDGETIRIDEVHRFDTPLIEQGDRLRWDLDVLWRELKRGYESARRLRSDLQSLSVNSWAVDFVRLDAAGSPIAQPFSYRDPRVHGMMDGVFGRMSKEEIYAITGIQFMEINTLYQLYADERAEPDLAKRTSLCLPIADYFNHRFGGRPVVERSMASTTQLLDARRKEWSGELLARLDLSADVLPPIVEPATAIGERDGVTIVAGCSHDTACAVAAVPAESGTNWAYLSCGTWSLLGIERTVPLLTDDACASGFSNEAGMDDTIRLLKNINGLWILQECEREWRAAGATYTYDELFGEASEIAFSDGVIDVDDGRFAERGDMVLKLREHCRERGLTVPTHRGEITRRILDGLADRHRAVLRELETLTGSDVDALHMVGGGSQIDLLCRLTADVCGCKVIAGPVEATTAGNHLIQVCAAGKIDALADVRDVVRRSFEIRYFPPAHASS